MNAWRDSRQEPAPLTRELVVCAVLAAAGLLGLAPLAGQSLVLLAVTGELGWPVNPLRALIAFLQGRPGVGLPREATHQLPADWIVLAAGAATELVVPGLLVAALGQALRAMGVLGVRGLADAREAAQALGVRELKRRAPVIRPDLHTTGRRGSRQDADR
jgi:hypothetical protein